MKKWVIVLIALCYGHKAETMEINMYKVMKFCVGLTTSMVIHETSHYLVAKAKGIDIQFSRFSWTSDEYSTSLQLAGLGGNTISSELILLTPKERRGAYFNGILIGNIWEEITYPIFRYNESGGDFGELRVSKSEKRLYAALFIFHGALTTYRVHKAGHLNLKTWFGRVEGTPMVGVAVNW